MFTLVSDDKNKKINKNVAISNGAVATKDDLRQIRKDLMKEVDFWLRYSFIAIV